MIKFTDHKLIVLEEKHTLWKVIAAFLFLLSFLLFFILAIGEGGFLLSFAGVIAYEKGIEIDKSEKRLRNFTKILFIKVGSWYPYQDLEYITVYISKEGKSLTSPDGKRYTITIFRKKQKPITIFKTLDKIQALKVFENARDFLEIEGVYNF